MQPLLGVVRSCNFCSAAVQKFTCVGSREWLDRTKDWLQGWILVFMGLKSPLLICSRIAFGD